MPLQRRLPKRGFRSRSDQYRAEVRLYHLAGVSAEVIDLEALKNAGIVKRDVRQVKVINTGTLDRAVTVKGLAVTRGARAVIEAAGGKVE